VVLNRHAPVYAAEIVRVLRPGGVFITQQVGGQNTQSIFSAFGWQSALETAFGRLGCTTRARAEYNVRHWPSSHGIESNEHRHPLIAEKPPT
jgi:hypothetical protein